MTQKPQKINLRFLFFLSEGNVLQKLSLRVQPFETAHFFIIYYSATIRPATNTTNGTEATQRAVAVPTI